MKKIVIGSSMKFRDTAKEAMMILESLGMRPLFPNIDQALENGGATESMEEKVRLARDHYRAVEEADAVYFIVPGGYMGTSCKIELGYALALRKPIYFSEPTGDVALDCYPKAIVPLDRLEILKSEV
jgi:nucleoside 2-deoxyribosyltransferase